MARSGPKVLRVAINVSLREPRLMNYARARFGFWAAGFCVWAGGAWAAAVPFVVPIAVPVVGSVIDATDRVVLAGSRPGWALNATDIGLVPPQTVIAHVIMALRRPPPRQVVVDQFMADLHTPQNARYHAWLRAPQMAAFGPAVQDIAALKKWLVAAGLTVNSVSPSGMRMDISGTAGRLAAVFAAMPHDVTLYGKAYVATLTQPALPRALAGIVAGVVLTNAVPQAAFVPAMQATGALAVAPADFATIYNLTPVLAGTSGFGVPVAGFGRTVAVLETADMRAPDWQAFRQYFGLAGYRGSLAQVHPSGCADPGLGSGTRVAAFDAEWAGVGAPDATIKLASCADSGFRPGVLAALQGVVEGAAGVTGGADVIAIGASACEANLGAGFLAAWHGLLEEAALQGMSVVVASGKAGAACDGIVAVDGQARLGAGVNGLAASPYALAVGGTDFGDVAAGNAGIYWHGRAAARAHGAVVSYLPEVVWNDGCASPNLAGGNTAQAACNAASPRAEAQGDASGGGASGFFARPGWQVAPGLSSGAARVVPDVALFAGGGVWGHFYLGCVTQAGGVPCAWGSPAQMVAQGGGGTAVAAAAFAGTVASLGQGKNGRLGLLAPRLYAMAGLAYANRAGLAQCAANRGRAVAPGCAFRNVTAGGNAVACAGGSADCVGPDPIGVLGGVTALAPGYNAATGLGSVNLAVMMAGF